MPRWSTSPMNPLWGSITHSPNLITPRKKTLHTSASPQRNRCLSFDSPGKMEKSIECQEPYASNIERGILVPSLSTYDQSNLSPTMQRALRVMRIHRAGSSEQSDLASPLATDNASINLSFVTEEVSPGARPCTSTCSDSNERNDSDADTSCAKSRIPAHAKSGLALSVASKSSCPETISSYRSHPMSLDGEFVAMKDTLDPSGGVRVRIRESSSVRKIHRTP